MAGRPGARHTDVATAVAYVMPQVEGQCLALEMLSYGSSIRDGRGRDIGFVGSE